MSVRVLAKSVLFGLFAVVLCLSTSLMAQESSSGTTAEVSKASEVAETAAHASTGEAAAHAEGDHAAGHHAPDPTVAGGGEALNNLLSFQSEKAIWTGIVFLIMMAILWAVAWRPITEALERRERMIANNIADAKNASDQALAKLKEYEAKLATAASAATDIVTQARKDAEHAGQRIIAQAQDEAARQRDRALADIESAKQIALSEMAAKSTDMAFGLARRVVGRELNTNDHQQLIQDAVSKLPSRN
jgi:F-type H+-transporting ATPase subunit b